MPATQAYTSNHLAVFHNRIAATENDEPGGMHKTMDQGRIVFNVLVPLMCRLATRYRRMRLVLSNLQRD